MTYQRREEIFSREALGCSEIMELLGVGKSTAYNIIAEIKRSNDRLGIEGKVHVQDYLDYYNLPVTRRYERP